MKVTILKENLKEGVKNCERICSKNISLPILNNILIKTEKNFLVLEATDLEIGLQWKILAKIDSEGGLVVPSKTFSNFINLLTQKNINLSTKDQFLILEDENLKTKIKIFDVEEFPIFPKISEGENTSLEINSFCQGLNSVVDFPIVSNTKPEISGIYFAFQKDQVILASTDTFRLAEKKIFLKKSLDLYHEYSFILPQKTVRELINIFNGREGEIKIWFNPNQVLFEFISEEISQPKIKLISRLIEGEYPNYREIIPIKYKTQIVLPKNEFLNQIKIASLFCGKTNEIKFKINTKENKIEILSQNPDLGEYSSYLPTKIKGEPLEISFNYKFLIDGLLNISSSNIIFELNGEDKPAVLKPENDLSYLYILMPIKTI